MNNALRIALNAAHANPADYPKGSPQSDEKKALAAPHIIARHAARGEVITAAEARDKYVQVIAAMLELISPEMIQEKAESLWAEVNNNDAAILADMSRAIIAREMSAKLRDNAKGLEKLTAAMAAKAESENQSVIMSAKADADEADMLESARELHTAALRAGVNVPALPAVKAEPAAVKPKATVHAIRHLPDGAVRMTRRERELNGLK